MAAVHTITPFLWFDHAVEEAAAFYCGLFQNSRVVQVIRWGRRARSTTDGCPARRSRWRSN